MAECHLRAESRGFSIVAHPVGFVVEGDPDAPDGRSVAANPPSGGRSESRIDAEGQVTVDLAAPLDVGRSSEWHVLKVLVQAISAVGQECALGTGAEDSRGEDGVILVEGTPLRVQIVSVPSDPDVWRDLAKHDLASLILEMSEVVAMVRTSVEKKRRYAEAMILALDASDIGAAVGPRLVAEYLARYDDPAAEFGWYQVWLVGPTLGSTIHLTLSASDV